MDTAHSFDDSVLGIVRTDQWEFFQEMWGHGDQGIFWPSGEPIHGTTREKTGEFERSLVGFKVVGSKKVKNFVFEKSLKPTFVGIFHRQARNRERCVGWHGRERRRNRRDCLAWAESLVRPFSWPKLTRRLFRRFHHEQRDQKFHHKKGDCSLVPRNLHPWFHYQLGWKSILGLLYQRHGKGL